jgi:hypothetical protein
VGKILLFIAGAGAAGGLLNAGLSGTGLMLPEVVNLPGGLAVWPGFIGNVFVGAVAALISFGLYGPLAGVTFLRASGPGGQQPGPAATPASTSSPMPLTLAALAGALLVGFSGGRWVTAEADRQVNRATVEVTANAAEKALQAAATPPPQAGGTAPPHVLTVSPSLPSAATPPPHAGVTSPKQPLSAALQAIQTSPPLEAYQKALAFQRMVNSPADGR